MNVDPDGKKSWKIVREDVLINSINALIVAVTGGYSYILHLGF